MTLNHVGRVVSNNAEQAQILGVGLSELGYRVVPTAANFLYCDLGEDALAFAERLRGEGVSVRPLGGVGRAELYSGEYWDAGAESSFSECGAEGGWDHVPQGLKPSLLRRFIALALKALRHPKASSPKAAHKKPQHTKAAPPRSCGFRTALSKSDYQRNNISKNKLESTSLFDEAVEIDSKLHRCDISTGCPFDENRRSCVLS